MAADRDARDGLTGPGGGLWVGLLGPLDVRRDGEPVAVSGGKSVMVLVTLALYAGRPVAVEALAQRVWAERLPDQVHASMQSHVTRLRRALGHATIRTVPSGYLLDVDPDQVDALRFRRLIAAADLGPTDAVRDLLHEALSLWRGEPLSGLPPDAFEHDEIPRLIEERLSVLQRRIDLDLSAGRHAEVVSELRGLTASNPLREPLWHQLIKALVASGRRAEALMAYHDLRTHLRDALGIDPDGDLQALYHQLLTEVPPEAPAPAPAAGSETTSRGNRAGAAPDQLPADVDDFTGRTREVAALRRVLTDEAAGAVPLCVVTGMPGAGKTALAVHVAHDLRDRFPDGQLYANLRGTEPEPRYPLDVLGSFLLALGAGGAGLPGGLDARRERYRTLIADRRMLVVLDDAAGERQVRPLLPGGPAAAVLITCRRDLLGLEGTHGVDLEALEPGDAIDLLARIAGTDRVGAEPEAAREIVERCDRLPLAVRIAGARLAARRHWRPALLAERLLDGPRRLDELMHGDLDVRSRLAASYRGLDELERRAFRLLGLLDVRDFPAWVAAVLLDLPPAPAQEVVERLRDARLLGVSGADPAGQLRYRFEELVRLFARERVAAEDPPDQPAASLGRVLGVWTAVVEGARRRLEPGGQAEPLAWFDLELPGLLACLAQACGAGLDGPAGALAAALARYAEARRQVKAS